MFPSSSGHVPTVLPVTSSHTCRPRPRPRSSCPPCPRRPPPVPGGATWCSRGPPRRCAVRGRASWASVLGPASGWVSWAATWRRSCVLDPQHTSEVQVAGSHSPFFNSVAHTHTHFAGLCHSFPIAVARIDARTSHFRREQQLPSSLRSAAAIIPVNSYTRHKCWNPFCRAERQRRQQPGWFAPTRRGAGSSSRSSGGEGQPHPLR